MGQNQLLLIVLSIIIVAVAIVVGIARFDEQAESSNRDAVILDLNRIAAFANTYYARPIQQLGGGNSFIGFEVPAAMDSTVNGVYTIVSAQETTLLLKGVGTYEVGDEYVTYQVSIGPNYITTDKIY